MIKVFKIAADYHNKYDLTVNHNVGYFAVEADKPNVLDAMSIAWDYARDYMADEYAIQDGYHAHVYPLGGGCGISLPDAQARELPIVNEDDLYDMEYEIHDFSDSDKEDIFHMLRNEIADMNIWWEFYLEEWCDNMHSKYSLDIDWQNDIEFYLGYVQRDSVCFSGRVEDCLFFLGAIGYKFASPSHRRLFAWLNHYGYVDIHAEKDRVYTDFYASVEAPEEVWIRHKDMVKGLDESIQEVVSDLGYEFSYNDLYRHIRNSYERYTTDESLTMMCDDYEYRFTWDKDKIGNWCAN